uniref:Ig-like domain-containing protein n=1 Tax=Myripristis murdjan TaxID=586833 RepID=A0A667WPZ0_9TELE
QPTAEAALHCKHRALGDIFLWLTAADDISPVQDEVSGTEGQSVTLTCSYQTSDQYIRLHWYRHQSDQAPQFILWKGAKSWSGVEHIPNNRYGSRTSDSSTELTIRGLTLADTALYYFLTNVVFFRFQCIYFLTHHIIILVQIIAIPFLVVKLRLNETQNKSNT